MGIKILNSKISYIVIALIVNTYTMTPIKKSKHVKHIYTHCAIFPVSLVLLVITAGLEKVYNLETGNGQTKVLYKNKSLSFCYAYKMYFIMYQDN